MSTHTKGPWSVLIEGLNCFIEDADWNTVARVSHPFPFTTNDDERNANARLIAAAPDYHEAAMSMIERHDAEARRCNFERCGCENCKPFRAIVAKATGTSGEVAAKAL